MIKKSYVYKDTTYTSADAVRQAIWKHDRKAFGTPQTADEWAELGVTYTETDVPEPEPTLDELKAQKLNELAQAFDAWREDGATLISSLGFEADADEKASADVGGLVTLGESATFMDAHNQPHALTLEQLKVLQKEIIQSGIAAYSTKWAYREAINTATTADALEAIHISFTAKDFTETSNE